MSTVLITGAARGLGLDFVKQYAAKGWKIHACARAPEALKQVKGDIHPHTLEVTDYAERYLVDRLSTVPGVSRANQSGARRAAMKNAARWRRQQFQKRLSKPADRNRVRGHARSW